MRNVFLNRNCEEYFDTKLANPNSATFDADHLNPNSKSVCNFKG